MCAEAGGLEGLLLGNWGELVALGSDERVVGVYKGVRAGRLRRVPRDYEYIDAELGDTAEGDLLLTDRRLFHLEYDYRGGEEEFERMPVVLRALYAVVAGFAVLSLLLIPASLLLMASSPPAGAALLLFSLFSLAAALGLASSFRGEPRRYRRVFLEVFLGDVRGADVYSSSSALLELRGRRAVSLEFRGEDELNDFRRNLSSLVYELRRRPREAVSYSIVTEFSLGEGGAVLVKCPYCGAPAPLESRESRVVCRYCGKTYIIPRRILDLVG